MSNDTPKPAESGPLDLAEIEARLNPGGQEVVG
jgi:hypothetical protein